MLNEKIYVFDDIIDIDLQEQIKNILVSDYEYQNHQFPWYYVDYITLSFDDPNSQRRPGSFSSAPPLWPPKPVGFVDDQALRVPRSPKEPLKSR